MCDSFLRVAEFEDGDVLVVAHPAIMPHKITIVEGRLKCAPLDVTKEADRLVFLKSDSSIHDAYTPRIHP